MKITSVTPKTASFKIELKNNVFTIGSCFSVEIAKYLEKNGINVVCNPFGTIYNPYSIFKALEILYNGNNIDEKKLIFENGVFFSPYCSTEFDGKTKDEALKKINDTIIEYRNKIRESDVFIITFGTAIVYKIKKSGEITANCHKLSENIFEKSALSFCENSTYIKESIEIIQKINKNAKIILTLSPVRHNPLNLVENSYSKSILRAALQENVDENADEKNVIYFPSYEIVLDELRNYSFYRKDGVHLKKQTVGVIMEKFENTFFSNDLKDYTIKLSKIKKTFSHKPFNPKTETYFNLLKKLYIDATEIYDLNFSLYIEKILYCIFFRIIKYFSTNFDADFIYSLTKSQNLLSFFDSIIKLEKGEIINPEKLNYHNKSVKRLESKKKNILLKYFIVTGEIEKIRKLMF